MIAVWPCYYIMSLELFKKEGSAAHYFVSSSGSIYWLIIWKKFIVRNDKPRLFVADSAKSFKNLLSPDHQRWGANIDQGEVNEWGEREGKEKKRKGIYWRYPMQQFYSSHPVNLFKYILLLNYM